MSLWQQAAYIRFLFIWNFTNLQNKNPEIEFKKVVSSALLPPYGPVYIELISSVAQKQIDQGSDSFKIEKDTNNLDYDNKVISIEGSLIKGQYDGEWKYYDDDGSLNKTLIWKNGEQIDSIAHK